MRWIWGGILLTVIAVNQSLVWAGGHGVERGPISWGLHARVLSESARELVGQEIQKACPAAFAGQDPEKPVVVTSMIAEEPDPQKPADSNRTRFLVELKRDSQTGAKKHDLAVIVENRRNLSEHIEVEVLTKGENGADCN